MRMLILNYKRMKNDFLKFSSRKLFFSVMLAAALLAGSSQSAFAGTAGVQSVMQSGTVKGCPSCSKPRLASSHFPAV